MGRCFVVNPSGILGRHSQPKTLLATHEQDIEQHNSQPGYQKLRTMVKRCLDQKMSAGNVEARHERIETGAPAKDKGTPVNVERK